MPILLGRALMRIQSPEATGQPMMHVLERLTSSQLRAIATLRQYGTLRSTSERLGRQPDTLRRSITNLEAVMARPLVNPSRFGLELTSDGKVFGTLVGAALAELHAAYTQVWDRLGSIGGAVEIGVVRATAADLVPTAILRTVQTAPNGIFRVLRDGYEEMLDALRSGRLDYVCTTVRDGIPPDIEGLALGQTVTRVFCRQDHPLMQGAPRSLAELARYPWVGPPAETGAAQAFRDTFSQAGLEPPIFSVETVSTEWTGRRLAQSDYLALFTVLATGTDYGLKDFASLPMLIIGAPRTVWLIHRKGWEPTRLQNLFAENILG
ncbi:LysR family transcriptional regulator [Paracoccus laeviglucosivorans]|uniref:DNA-binding transcriptional regulator, LysR family n=1 Tax=Paracoccus laeviglucosivorans TaxID=1197861 RepID=A0A521FAE7_9RHOB|nr:LysR family transcriptional regulator [Paracoccus laeviglucosivorans]SMO93126.1 DNA-binding transcriptional regulator, LysR family [Paracoccus laeviglucosivorans]